MTKSILRLSSLQERVGLSRSSIYDRLNPGSPRFDPNFPKPIALGGGARTRAIGWVEAEVDAFIEARIRLSRLPEPRAPKRKRDPGR
jgi:prophage regulatory protein